MTTPTEPMAVSRAAVYWTPAPTDPLFAAGSTWLGRDAEHAVSLTQPDWPGLVEATETARTYGFHATLRPPMRLATTWPDFLQAVRSVASQLAPFDLPPLQVADMAGFVALRETSPCPALHRLADACVAGTEAHRLPADAAELAKRRGAGLSNEQDALLLRWGYPYVMQRWRFHMTLSRRLAAAEMARLLPVAHAHFAPSLALARRVDGVAVFTQRAGGPFLISERIQLG